MKNTAFTDFHVGMGAKMVPFAGHMMPLQYEGVTLEHENVRNGIGVFDVSHMGEFYVTGTEAFELVQRLTTNDVAVLWDGKVQYSCFPNGKGGIVDDLLVYRIDAENYLLVVNASNIEKDWEWVNKNNVRGAKLRNASDATAQLAVQGPFALKAMQKLTSENVTDMEYYTFKIIEFAGVKDVIFSTTGYTGSGGCEIYCRNEDASQIWHAVFDAGRESGIKPTGLAARDTLRLEMGFCLYGNDINDTTSPIEAGLGWITKFVDGNDFVDRNLLESQKNNGVSKRLRGFEMIDKGIPRQHYEICDAQGKQIGEVTSGTMSPSTKKAVGMGYIEWAHSKIGHEVYIKIREKLIKAKIVKTPFYQAP